MKASASGLVALLVLIASVVGCGRDEAAVKARVRRVGPRSEYRSIQAAVDSARPGDLILVQPGTYREAVVVTTDRLVIRGLDRNEVVLDGGGELLDGIHVVADGVAIENLTVRRYAVNGVVFSSGYEGDQDGPVGWRASYVTASNNGLYGLYAFGATGGQFDHDYASGHPDSGIYVGQCRGCEALVIDNVAERNAIGYENTNASGVTVVRNTWRRNRIGMSTNSQDTESLAPQAGSHIVANLITDNDDPETPASSGGFGVGIAIAGGTTNTVERNVITDHVTAAVVVMDQDRYRPMDNRIIDNVLRRNGVDLVFGLQGGGRPDPGDNCFAGNDAAKTVPAGLELLLPCDGAAGTLRPQVIEFPRPPAGVALDQVPWSEPQPSMPDAEVERWAAASAHPAVPDLAQVRPPS